jgi:hypothetical protein
MELRTRPQTIASTWKDLYYTHKEIEEGISDNEEDESDIATDSEDDTETQFDLGDDEDFNPKCDAQDVQDMDMRVWFKGSEGHKIEGIESLYIYYYYYDNLLTYHPKST